MPKLSPVQWTVVAFVFAFYGFAVFALTRDYYLRNAAPVSAAAPTAGSPHGLPKPQEQRTWIQGEMNPGDSAIPKAIVEMSPLQLQQRADELFAQKRYEAAIPLYRRLIDLDPGDVEAYNDLGLALHYSGQSRAGLDVLRSGVAKDSEHQRIWLSLGFVGVQSSDHAAAREALQKARGLDPDSTIGQEAERMLGLLDGE